MPLRVAIVLALLSCAALLPNDGTADERDTLKVGLQPDGRIVVPTNQILQPAGTQVTFPGRPVDILAIEDGKLLVAKNMKDLVFIDPATGKMVQTLALPAAAKGLAGAFSAVGLVAVGERVYATDSQGAVRVAKRNAEGKYGWEAALALKAPTVGGAAYPTGIALQGDSHAWVCASRGNELQLMKLDGGEVEARVPVGVAPYMPVVVKEKVYVSNWGGDHPTKDDPTSKSSGTPTKIDPRTSVANHGSVSVVEKVGGEWKQTKTITVGGHPSGITASAKGKFVYVANANSDTVSVIDTATDKVVETIDCKPEAKLPFGTGSNAVALGADGLTLYVANGTGNCVAVVALGSLAGGPVPVGEARPSRVNGMIPTDWYPGAVRLSADGKRLFVANVKGHGALQPRKVDPKAKKPDGKEDDPAAPQKKGKNSHDHLGSVSIIDVPGVDALKKMTETVNANNRLGYSIAGMEKPRPDAKPVPVPERHGEPSVFEHVIYVIKENRTYDQVFGDIKEGNGDASLCIFGEEVTPNHHKLAREFVLLDNFYCSGVLSAPTATRGRTRPTPPTTSKSSSGSSRAATRTRGATRSRSRPQGSCGTTPCRTKKTFRNYGEFVKTTYEPKGAKWLDVYADYTNGTSKVKITATPNMRSLDKYSHPNFPGFPLTTPDVYRAKLFIDELKEFEKKGDVPATSSTCSCRRTTPTARRPDVADAAGDGRGQRPRPRHGGRGGVEEQVLGEDVHRRDGGRPAERVRPRRRPPHRRPGDLAVHEAQSGRFDLLQPDGNGKDDRVDPRAAADDAARPERDADARVLHRQSGPDAVHVGEKPDRAGRDEQADREARRAGEGVRAEVAGAGLRGRGSRRRRYFEPYPVVQRARRRAVPRRPLTFFRLVAPVSRPVRR